MKGPYYVYNGQLDELAHAVVPLDDVNFAYGYGVYETLKVRHGLVYFVDFHVRRLLQSARIIGLDPGFGEAQVTEAIYLLAKANGQQDANLKILLIGRNAEKPWGSEAARPVAGTAGPDASDVRTADLYIMALNPLFPKRVDYRDGVSAVVFCGERVYPMAKSLNMLASTMAFREARSRDAYDAVLLDRRGILREGTRTNLFYTDGTTIFTPPAWTVLEGVTRQTILECCTSKGYRTREQELALADLLFEEERTVKGLWLSSTSSKIMPVRRLEPAGHTGPGAYSQVFGLDGAGSVPWTALVNSPGLDFGIPEIVRDLMRDYDAWLDDWAKEHQ